MSNNEESLSVWDRLARLDACCDVSMHSVHLRAGPGAGDAGTPVWELNWEVVVRPRHAAAGSALCVRRPSLILAIEAALQEAQRRGMLP